MKRFIHAKEYIEAMATIGFSTHPNFSVAVNPDSGRGGDCYFKYLDRESYNKAEHIARIDFKSCSRFYHKNRDGKKEWRLNGNDIDALIKFLSSECDEWAGVTNWQSALYHWNLECHLMTEPFPKDRYSSKIEAFLDKFYDPLYSDDVRYVPSTTVQPDYTNLPRT